MSSQVHSLLVVLGIGLLLVSVVESTKCEQVQAELVVGQPMHKLSMAPSNDKAVRLATNHKTGTFFAKCLCDVLGKGDVCKVTGIHTKGHNFAGNRYSVNMVRNPFVLVHSGYQYHLKALEAWIRTPYYEPKPVQTGANAAVNAYEDWCMPGKTQLHLDEDPDMTYVQMLSVLNVTEGLIVESVRALHRDIPRMLEAIKNCDLVHTTTDLGEGDCVNILLDDIMEDYGKAYDQYLIPNLNLFGTKADTPTARLAFTSQCDPTSATASSAQYAHTTAHGAKREKGIALLRELDLAYLGGKLHEAESQVLPYLARAYTGKVH